MRPPLNLQLPKHRRGPLLPVALAVSVGVHIVLVLVGAIDAWIPSIPPRPPQAEAPVEPAAGDTMPLVFLHRPPPQPPTQPAPEAPRRVTTPREQPRTPAIVPEAPPPPVTLPLDSGPPPVAEAPTPQAPPPSASAQPAAPGPAGIGRIGPGLGEGKLWVRPLPIPPRELAKRFSRPHAELVDSAVTAVVQAYLDSIANDPSSRDAALPDWTTKIAGKRYGLDSTAIYIAGLRIPAAVLALMPVPGGNIDQNRAYNQMLEYRADIQRAALRADNLQEFKERIKEIRLRKEREEEFDRHRRAPPPSEIQPAPPVPQPPPRRDTVQMGEKQ